MLESRGCVDQCMLLAVDQSISGLFGCRHGLSLVIHRLIRVCLGLSNNHQTNWIKIVRKLSFNLDVRPDVGHL